MEHTDLGTCLQNALTKAFSAKCPAVRAAYMDLADFYGRQLQRRGQSWKVQQALYVR